MKLITLTAGEYNAKCKAGLTLIGRNLVTGEYRFEGTKEQHDRADRLCAIN